MNAVKTICVFGVGGVGGYFGAKMADSLNSTPKRDTEVFFIARGEHLKVIQAQGITLVTPEKTIQARPTLAAAEMDPVPDPNLILLCVKGYDLENALNAIRPRVQPHTLVLPLLNGVDIYERIRAVLTTGIVLPACVYVGTYIHQPGVIHQSGGDGRILFGQDPGQKELGLNPLGHFFENIGINYQFARDPFPAIWEKFMFIAAYGLVTAQTGKTVGEVLKDEESKACIQGIMGEIASIAKRKEIELPENIIAESMAKGKQFPFSTKTSYQRDVEQPGRKNEGDLFGGAILRQGRVLGIPTPVTESIYSKIQNKG
ncbi:MAG: 2-dehydropantoate 2-reductase [Desulfobacteraceae bacterium]|nr:2-dehydropantoate 2-reductase [Desulfobacteraceae bacterium]